jgi:hypothetical protein
MENRWLLTWLLAPLFSTAAIAVEAYSLRWYKLDADTPSMGTRAVAVVIVIALTLFSAAPAAAQGASRTLVAVFAHADDEGPAAPVLARYAREGAHVYLVVATDGAQGGAHTSIPRGAELARVRSEEARCATDALGMHPPILLGFPDAQLGNYPEDPARLFRLTERVQRNCNGSARTW